MKRLRWGILGVGFGATVIGWIIGVHGFFVYRSFGTVGSWFVDAGCGLLIFGGLWIWNDIRSGVHPMATVKGLRKTSLACVAIVTAYVWFRYVGEFSELLCGVIVVLGLVGYELFGRVIAIEALQRPEKFFPPFSVSIWADWRSLLSDFGLVRSEEDWQRFNEAIEKVPRDVYSAARSGISFSVVAPPSDEDRLPGLTYLQDSQRFVARVDLSEMIPEFAFLLQGGHSLDSHPTRRYFDMQGLYFTLDRTSGRGEIGLTVGRYWWEGFGETKGYRETGEIGDLAKIESKWGDVYGTLKLPIARLPYSEFAIYYQKRDYDRGKGQKEAQDKELAAFGWQRKIDKDSGGYYEPDPLCVVEHKYFTVAHQRI
jgi:hypothetical protein